MRTKFRRGQYLRKVQAQDSSEGNESKKADKTPLHQPVPKPVDSASPKNLLIFCSITMSPGFSSSGDRGVASGVRESPGNPQFAFFPDRGSPYQDSRMAAKREQASARHGRTLGITKVTPGIAGDGIVNLNCVARQAQPTTLSRRDPNPTTVRAHNDMGAHRLAILWSGSWTPTSQPTARLESDLAHR